MLVTSIFSFSHNVFKILFPQGRLESMLCDKEFKESNHFLNYLDLSAANAFNPDRS